MRARLNACRDDRVKFRAARRDVSGPGREEFVMPVDSYECGDLLVDLRRVEVRRGGRVVPLEPKAFDVLRHLIENRDRLVTKDELLDVVWKATFVTPNVLTRAVAQLRKALGDDAFESRFIETVARRGYRFIAPVEAARRATAPATAVPSPRRLTVTSDSHVFPSIATDGRAVASASDRTGAMEIYLAGLTEGSGELRLTADGGHNIHPALSPDGRWLAYHSRGRGGIWVVPATGGSPRRVADFGSMPSWSPDNETLAFTSDAGGMSSQAALWTVRCKGEAPVALTRLGRPPGGHLAPAWSHDGRLIAFRVGRHAEADLWMVAAGGGEPWRLAYGTAPWIPRFSPDDRPSAAIFGSDDRTVIWIANTADGDDCLMRAALTRDGEAAAGPEVILSFPGKSVGGISMARDGTAVLSLSEGSTNLFAVDVEGGAAITAPVQLTSDDVLNTQPDYGPNGRIAYEQQVVGRPITAWLMDDDGKNKEPLSAGLSVSVQAPQWDGQAKRVFAQVTEPGSPTSDFMWMDLDTRQLCRISAGPSRAGSPPQLSPDDRQLAFHVIDADGVMNVWLQDLAGGAERQITFDREAVAYPRWSQDGRWLGVVIKRGEHTHIGVVAAGGGPVEQLTFDRGQSRSSSFSPDSEWIAFAGERAGIWNIYTVSRRTKEVNQLTHFATADPVIYPVWSPRGNRIVFERTQRKGSLWTLKLASAPGPS